MKLLAIMGSPRKGKATDTLVDKAIEGAKAACPDIQVKKLILVDKEIGHCVGCLTCRDSKTTGPVAQCAIRDDMDSIVLDILEVDLLIIGTPLRMGHVTSILMKFLERVCWAFAKPAGRVLTVKGCPVPRSPKERRSVTIITNSIVPPIYRMFCDDASSLIKGTLKDSLNAKTVGELYAGDIDHRGVDFYMERAFKLGQKLVLKK